MDSRSLFELVIGPWKWWIWAFEMMDSVGHFFCDTQKLLRGPRLWMGAAPNPLETTQAWKGH